MKVWIVIQLALKMFRIRWHPQKASVRGETGVCRDFMAENISCEDKRKASLELALASYQESWANTFVLYYIWRACMPVFLKNKIGGMCQETPFE